MFLPNKLNSCRPIRNAKSSLDDENKLANGISVKFSTTSKMILYCPTVDEETIKEACDIEGSRIKRVTSSAIKTESNGIPDFTFKRLFRNDGLLLEAPSISTEVTIHSWA